MLPCIRGDPPGDLRQLHDGSQKFAPHFVGVCALAVERHRRLQLAQRGPDQVFAVDHIVSQPQAVDPLGQVGHLAGPDPAARTSMQWGQWVALGQEVGDRPDTRRGLDRLDGFRQLQHLARHLKHLREEGQPLPRRSRPDLPTGHVISRRRNAPRSSLSQSLGEPPLTPTTRHAQPSDQFSDCLPHPTSLADSKADTLATPHGPRQRDADQQPRAESRRGQQDG